jgi:hypothetical protein
LEEKPQPTGTIGRRISRSEGSDQVCDHDGATKRQLEPWGATSLTNLLNTIHLANSRRRFSCKAT